MNDRAISSLLDIAPAYLNFAIQFLRQTRTAFVEHAKSGKVSADLTSILVGGVALSYLIAIVAAPVQLKQDPSLIIRWLGDLEYYQLPFIGLFAAVILAVATHILGKLYAKFSTAFNRKAPGPWEPQLGGTLENSVNAALGFAAVFLPVTTATLCMIAWLPQNIWSIVIPVIFLIGFIIVYFPLALACTHPDTGFRQAWLAMAGAMVLAFLSVEIFKWFAGAV
jgi:hypothetical protein